MQLRMLLVTATSSTLPAHPVALYHPKSHGTGMTALQHATCGVGVAKCSSGSGVSISKDSFQLQGLELERLWIQSFGSELFQFRAESKTIAPHSEILKAEAEFRIRKYAEAVNACVSVKLLYPLHKDKDF